MECPHPVEFPGTDDEYISGARIANSFAELGPGFEWRIPKDEGLRFTEDFELVGCFMLLNEGNRIVKQWVVDPDARGQSSAQAVSGGDREVLDGE